MINDSWFLMQNGIILKKIRQTREFDLENNVEKLRRLNQNE